MDHHSHINNSNISQLAFMDDTTIVSSSIQGLTEILSIAQEFYQLNNTKINFNKADLICNRDPSSPTDPLPFSPASFQFLSYNINFAVTPLSPSTSFRFLGVW